MTRPITLFTGQWADLPFEEMCKLASGWGYDGLEIACWGDHFDPWAAVEDDAYVPAKLEMLKKYDLQVFAISNHLKGQAVCDDPIDERHRGILPDRIWGDGDAEGVRQRAAEEMKMTARAARKLGCRRRRRLHRLVDLEVRRDVPARLPGPRRRGLRGLRQPLEPDPGRLRQRGREVRPRGAPVRDRLRLLDHRAHHGGHRPPRGLRPELGPVATSSGRTSTRSASSGTSRTGSTTSTARTRRSRSATAATAGWAPTSPGPTRDAAGTSCPPATATSRGKRASGCSTPSATTAPSRSSGRTPAWTGSSAPPKRWSSSAGSPSTHRPLPSTPPSRRNRDESDELT